MNSLRAFLKTAFAILVLHLAISSSQCLADAFVAESKVNSPQQESIYSSAGQVWAVVPNLKSLDQDSETDRVPLDFARDSERDEENDGDDGDGDDDLRESAKKELAFASAPEFSSSCGVLEYYLSCKTRIPLSLIRDRVDRPPEPPSFSLS
jgi:hypothetical protein